MSLRILVSTSMLVLCTLLPNVAMGNKKTGIFSKIASTKRDMQRVVSTGIEKGSSWAAASAAGRQGGMLEGFFDMFETMLDKQWGTPNSLLDQDLMGLMQDVFVRDPEHTRLLQEAWADPEIFRYLVDELPFFSVIKPLRALREKKVLSSQDGIEAVVKLKETMGRVISSLQSVRDPEAFAEKMYNYATSTDSKWRSLLERVEKGDKTASLDMQQFLLNKEIGDLIDLEAFGFGGVLPDVLSKAISSVREQEPLIWNSVLSDPVAKRYLEDPMLAVKEALDVAKDYGEAMMKSL